MKKILTILAVLIATATVSTAQIGARIGMDFASFRGDWRNPSGHDDYKTNIGLHLGVVYNIELADALSLQPGAFYVQRNWKRENSDHKIHSHHIEVPVVMKYNLELTSDIKIDPHVGPYFGFGFAGKNKDEESEKVFKKRYDKKTGTYQSLGLKNFDMGIQMGVGATFFESAYVGFDFELGFNDLTKFKAIDGKAVDIHHNMFMITFGVWLPE